MHLKVNDCDDFDEPIALEIMRALLINACVSQCSGRSIRLKPNCSLVGDIVVTSSVK